MYRFFWLSAFFAICGLYVVPKLWVLGVVMHTVLLFAWLVAGAGRRP